MPSGPFAHVCLLVNDLDKAIEDWTKILGVLDPGQLKEQIVKYDQFSGGADAGMKWATFVSHHGAEIQFIQPSPGTPLGRRLEKHGEHVHHINENKQDNRPDIVPPDNLKRLLAYHSIENIGIIFAGIGLTEIAGREQETVALNPFVGPPDASGGPSLACAVIVKIVDAQTRSKTSVNELLRD